MYSKNLEQCLVKIVRSKGLLCKFHTELALKSTCPLAIAAILKIYIFLFISISRIIFLIPLSWQFWPPHVKSWLIGKDWCWEELGTGGERDDRGWDSWMASPTRWTWVWVNSGRWWCTGRPCMLRFMGSQRVGHDWATNWTDNCTCYVSIMLLVTFHCSYLDTCVFPLIWYKS